MSQHSTNQSNENLEILLKEKFRRDELRALKEQVKMPGQEIASKKVFPIKRVMSLAAAIILLVGFSAFFLTGSEEPSSYASNLIQTAQFATLSDLETRGEGGVVSNTQDVGAQFDKAVQLAKGNFEDKERAIQLLEPLSTTKNKYQNEAMYLRALALASNGYKEESLQAFKHLANHSQYQKININKMINLLSE